MLLKQIQTKLINSYCYALMVTQTIASTLASLHEKQRTQIQGKHIT